MYMYVCVCIYIYTYICIDIDIEQFRVQGLVSEPLSATPQPALAGRAGTKPASFSGSLLSTRRLEPEFPVVVGGLGGLGFRVGGGDCRSFWGLEHGGYYCGIS